jgi:hypothetical protein
MAAAVNSDHKKKSLHHVDRTPRDGGSGMNAQTQRHFEHVKRKLFAFVDRQHRLETDAMHLSPPIHPMHNPQAMFVDQKKVSKHRLIPPSPVPSHKHSSAHRQLPHLALATPQMARRSGKH